ncbi:hypothetical protein KSP39_PZI023140 [Platanthera zijinensis]|uniref:YTH domain-containing family protein n=1 Tax=Platanthera zijinensis TaxID=2320716 RepID=A0AAP0AUK3_9ASPA
MAKHPPRPACLGADAAIDLSVLPHLPPSGPVVSPKHASPSICLIRHTLSLYPSIKSRHKFNQADLDFLKVSQQQTPFSGLGSSINSHNQGYFHDGRHQHGNNFGSPTHRMINDGHSLITTDQGRRRHRGNASRGPRATQRRTITNEQSLPLDSKNSNTPGVDRELYNMPDFNIDYNDAKFFIIKSYSEENIHKSIKYGVWASTVYGNNKLDSAYCAAKRKVEPCPVFLFFSVILLNPYMCI